jgi:hypothetical protein
LTAGSGVERIVDRMVRVGAGLLGRYPSVAPARRPVPCEAPKLPQSTATDLTGIQVLSFEGTSKVIERIRTRCTYANVVATVALFAALGGSSYAALRVGSGEIVNNSVRGKDIRNRTITHRDVGRNALGGTNIKESRLGTVPRADSLTASGATMLKLRCPPGTQLAAGLCFESSPRQPSSYYSGVSLCGAVNSGNRRLPTHAELIAFFAGGGTGPAPGGELTANAVEAQTGPEPARVLIAVDRSGGLVFAQASEVHAFRCVTNPSN